MVPLHLPSGRRRAGDRAGQAHGHRLLRQPGDAGARRPGPGEGRPPAQRAGPRPRDRPHGGHARHPRGPRRRRPGPRLHVLVRRSARRPRPTPIPSATSSPGARAAFCWPPRTRPSSSRTAGSSPSRPRTSSPGPRSSASPGSGNSKAIPTGIPSPIGRPTASPRPFPSSGGRSAIPAGARPSRRWSSSGFSTTPRRTGPGVDLPRPHAGACPRRAPGADVRRPPSPPARTRYRIGHHLPPRMAGAVRGEAASGGERARPSTT